MTHNVITLASLIHSQFVTVDRIDYRKDGLIFHISAMSDPEVRGITLRVSARRAEQLGMAKRLVA